MAPTRLLALRHGESVWNAIGRWQGQADTELSDAGRRQALLAAEQLARAPLGEGGERRSAAAAASTAGAGSGSAATGARAAFDGIFSSPLQRAAETAAIIAAQLGIGPVLVDDRLGETDVGSWEGLTHAEIEAEWPNFIATNQRPPDAEPLADVAVRAAAAFVDIAASTPGGEVLVITHAGLLRTLCRALGQDPPDRYGNLCGLWFEVDGEQVCIGESVQLVTFDPVTDAL